jgi:tetratricopeptide (TPR) repeat protein
MLHTLFRTVGAQYSNGNLDAVESAVRSILAMVPNDLASLQFLGLVYYRTGRKTEAIRILEAQAPQQDQALRFETAPGDDFLSRNGYSAAAACHVEATQRNRDLALAWYDLGLVLNELGRHESALRAFRSALAACPGHSNAMLAMSSVALDLKARAQPVSSDSSSAEDDE